MQRLRVALLAVALAVTTVGTIGLARTVGDDSVLPAAESLVPEAPADRKSEGDTAPIVLDVTFRPSLRPAAAPGREQVDLAIVVGLAPLRERLGVGREARFVVRIRATTPRGTAMAREVVIRVPALPADGELRYETSLVAPEGTSGFGVEVREEASGASGAAGPWSPALATTATVAPPVPPSGPGAFTDSAEVRIGEARFLEPADGPPATDAIRITWKGRDQRLLRVAGGPASSLELGVAIDVSESVTPERTAFARLATEATARLLGSGDRAFRVDFGLTPRFVGAVHDTPGPLFAVTPTGPEKTAIFDALRFALERFEQAADRRALVVFTDGCETAGRTGWRAVERMARRKAIPVFVVLAGGKPCQRFVQVRVEGTRITSVTTFGKSMAPLSAPPQIPAPIKHENESRLVDDPASQSRFVLGSLARSTGGLVIRLKQSGQAGDVWAEVERALAHLWVAVFEPSDPRFDPGDVEVRSARGEILRPGP